MARPIRVEKELAEWFDHTFPWRGSFPQFVNAALAEFRKQWGDRLPPSELLNQAMANMVSKY